MTLSDYLKTADISQAAFAARLGVTQGLISQFVLGVLKPTAERCIQIELETGGAVTCEELRPDIKWHLIRGTRPFSDRSMDDRREDERRKGDRRHTKRRKAE